MQSMHFECHKELFIEIKYLNKWELTMVLDEKS